MIELNFDKAVGQSLFLPQAKRQKAQEKPKSRLVSRSLSAPGLHRGLLPKGVTAGQAKVLSKPASQQQLQSVQAQSQAVAQGTKTTGSSQADKLVNEPISVFLLV